MKFKAISVVSQEKKEASAAAATAVEGGDTEVQTLNQVEVSVKSEVVSGPYINPERAAKFVITPPTGPRAQTAPRDRGWGTQSEVQFPPDARQVLVSTDDPGPGSDGTSHPPTGPRADNGLPPNVPTGPAAAARRGFGRGRGFSMQIPSRGRGSSFGRGADRGGHGGRGGRHLSLTLNTTTKDATATTGTTQPSTPSKPSSGENNDVAMKDVESTSNVTGMGEWEPYTGPPETPVKPEPEEEDKPTTPMAPPSRPAAMMAPLAPFKSFSIGGGRGKSSIRNDPPRRPGPGGRSSRVEREGNPPSHNRIESLKSRSSLGRERVKYEPAPPPPPKPKPPASHYQRLAMVGEGTYGYVTFILMPQFYLTSFQQGL